LPHRTGPAQDWTWPFRIAWRRRSTRAAPNIPKAEACSDHALAVARAQQAKTWERVRDDPAPCHSRSPEKTLSEDLTDAAIALGFLTEVKVKGIDKEGNETETRELQFTGKDGRKGYLMWLGMNVPASFANLMARQMPTEMNVKSDHHVVVAYGTIEEARDALREVGIDPLIVEQAMQPKFLQHKPSDRNDN
jgi:hypothetical protein